MVQPYTIMLVYGNSDYFSVLKYPLSATYIFIYLYMYIFTHSDNTGIYVLLSKIVFPTDCYFERKKVQQFMNPPITTFNKAGF